MDEKNQGKISAIIMIHNVFYTMELERTFTEKNVREREREGTA